MNDTLSKVAIFAAGAGIGSVVTWRFVKEYYSKLAKEEIEDVKRAFSRKSENKRADPVIYDESSRVEKKTAVSESEIREYAAKIQEEGYTNYSDTKTPVKIEEKKVDDVERPRVISPEEYDDNYDYEAIELTLYSDGVLVDDMNNPIEDVDDIVGLSNLDTFGRYEDDAVHVRNDKRKCDYEILRDPRKYSDTVKRPHQAEDE